MSQSIDDDEAECVDLNSVQIHPDELFFQAYSELVDACGAGMVSTVQAVIGGVTEDTARRLLAFDGRRSPDDPGVGTVLQAAVFGERLDLIEYLAGHPCIDLEQESSSSANFTEMQTSTALMVACKMDHYLAAKLLLEKGAWPDHGVEMLTPLVLACIEGSADLVDVLLKHKANPTFHPYSAVSHDSSLPLYLACLRGNLDIVERLLVHLQDPDHSLVSLEQLILCRSVLGLQLIKTQTDIPTGISFWQSALREFENLVRPKYGSLHEIELSRALHRLYLTESAAVQNGKKIVLGPVDLLPRTHSRFPDFKLCVHSGDIGRVFQVDSDTARLHAIIVRGCTSQHNKFWSDRLSLFTTLDEIQTSSLSKEHKRLCLLVCMENAVSLKQYLQITEVAFLLEMMTMLVNEDLHRNNPGYLMLIIDILNESVQSILASGNLSTCKNQRLGLTYTAEVVAKLTYLILCDELNEFQKTHMAKLVSTFIRLCRKGKTLVASLCMEFDLLLVPVMLLVEDENGFIWRVNGDDSRKENKCLELMNSFLRCGAVPNSRDARGNTAMLLCMGVNEPLRSDMIELLIAYGGHVDITNHTGVSPYHLLRTLPDNRIDLFKCRTLKCRAASAISFYKIEYENKVPIDIEEFIKLHDTCTQTNLAAVK